MGQRNLNRINVSGEELQKGIEQGVTKVYKLAKTAYGPQGGNVMIEHRATPPSISHDGVTNIDALEVSDPIEDMAIKVVKQASARTNATAGDGTTLSSILAYHVYHYAMDEIRDGKSPADVSKEILANVPKILEKIDEATIKDPSEALLRGACKVSAGDEGLGELIYDVVSQVGEYGGINVTYVGTLGVRTNIVDGMYVNSGYADSKLVNDFDNNCSVLDAVPVVVLGNTITRQDELLPILENIRVNNYRKAIFFADITGDALKLLEMNRNFDCTVVKPNSGNYEVLLNDVALYTGGKVFSGSPKDFKLEDYAGLADKVVVTNRETTITGGHGEASEIAKVVGELKAKLKKAEPQDRAYLESRIARLTANVATIYVGGASQVERGEVKLRVDDAVCASKSAITSGVVPGGGVCLNDISISLGIPYLHGPFRDLLENSGVNNASSWQRGCGYNVNTGALCDMVEECIVDPALVVKEAVINSHSVIAKLITTKTAMVFEDRSWEF